MFICKHCNDPKADQDLVLFGNHYCKLGKRIPPEKVLITNKGEAQEPDVSEEAIAEWRKVQNRDVDE